MLGQTQSVVDLIMDELQVFRNLEARTIGLIIVGVIGIIMFFKFMRSR